MDQDNEVLSNTARKNPEQSLIPEKISDEDCEQILRLLFDSEQPIETLLQHPIIQKYYEEISLAIPNGEDSELILSTIILNSLFDSIIQDGRNGHESAQERLGVGNSTSDIKLISEIIGTVFQNTTEDKQTISENLTRVLVKQKVWLKACFLDLTKAELRQTFGETSQEYHPLIQSLGIFLSQHLEEFPTLAEYLYKSIYGDNQTEMPAQKLKDQQSLTHIIEIAKRALSNRYLIAEAVSDSFVLRRLLRQYFVYELKNDRFFLDQEFSTKPAEIPLQNLYKFFSKRLK